MDKYYHITIDDGAPLPTEDDMKAFAEKIGITYEVMCYNKVVTPTHKVL